LKDQLAAKIFVSIGSNINRQQNIATALHLLEESYGQLQISPIYESTAVGFVGDDFYNLVVSFDSTQTIGQLKSQLCAIECQISEQLLRQAFQPRGIDLDLLLVGDSVQLDSEAIIPRDDILKFAFVLKPLADLAPNLRHPIIQLSYAELWQSFNKDLLVLRQVD
jgi:2-amino-4-hydroxy-6-hydroxymethyldihydropteridine diphosphokinase